MAPVRLNRSHFCVDRGATMHLPEIAIEEALREGECALCWLTHRHLLRRVSTLLDEHLTDPQWRQSLHDENGFCAYHAALVLSRADVLSVAILAEDVLASVSLSMPSRRRPGGWRCHLCESQRQDEAQAAKLLAQLLRQAEWRERYAASQGLCLPHVRQVLLNASPEVRDWLVANEGGRWQGLRAQLREVIRKHDYRFQQEPWGEERGSWRRAFHKLYGIFPEEVSHER